MFVYFPKFAIFLEDYEGVSFGDIKNPIIRHLNNVRQQYSDYFPELYSHPENWVVNPIN